MCTDGALKDGIFQRFDFASEIRQSLNNTSRSRKQPSNMLALLRKLPSRLREHGLGYFVLLVRNELAQPRLKLTDPLRRVAVGLLSWVPRRRSDAQAAWSDGCLQFVYDLSRSTVSFDFVSFIAAAEVERRLRGLDGINVIFIRGPHKGLREEPAEYDAIVDADARMWRVRHMLTTILAFLPSVRGYTVCTREQANALISREARHLYPTDYRVYLPREPAKRVIHEHARNGVPIWPMLSATVRGRRFVDEYLNRVAKGRRPIVITLRNYGYTPDRNSRNADWLKFADNLDPARYAAIFVPDAETVTREPPVDLSRHAVCEMASVNLEIRMALYDAAWLNMALMHGPCELCWYNERARYLYFITVGNAAVTTAEALVFNGHRVGADLDFAKPYQHIVWESDELPTIEREFRAMEKLLVDFEHQWRPG